MITSALCVMVTVPLQLSVAVTAPSSAAGTSPEQLTVVLAGMNVIVGAVWSFTGRACGWDGELLPTSAVV